MGRKKSGRVYATLMVSHLSVHDLIGKANAIVEAMTGNKSLPSPLPTLAVLTSAVSVLVNAQAIALTRAKGSAAERDAKQTALLALLQQFRQYVQTVVDADPTNAPAVIEGAGLHVRRAPTVHPKQNLALHAGAVSGAVKVVAKSQGDRASYDWQWGTDGRTWTSLPSTLQAHTSLVGLTPR